MGGNGKPKAFGMDTDFAALRVSHHHLVSLLGPLSAFIWGTVNGQVSSFVFPSWESRQEKLTKRGSAFSILHTCGVQIILAIERLRNGRADITWLNKKMGFIFFLLFFT